MTRRRKFWVTVAALLVAVTLSGCGEVISLAYPGTTCNWNVNDVHRSQGKPSDMDVKATVTCNSSVSYLSIRVKIQKLSGLTWVDLTELRGQEFPATASGKKRTVMQAYPCALVAGTFRGVGYMTVRQGKEGVSRGPTYSVNTTTNPCA